MTRCGCSDHFRDTLSSLYIRCWLMYQLLGSVMPNFVGRNSRLVQLSSKIRRLQRFHRADTGGEVFAGIVTGIVTGSFALLRMTLVHFFVDAERVDNFQVVFEFAGDGLWRDMVLGVEFLLQCAATVRLVDGLLQTCLSLSGPVRFSV